MEWQRQQPVLVLKIFDKIAADSLRIYKMTGDAVELFNNYVLDFFESIKILSEKRETPGSSEIELDESITFIRSKIEDITFEMKKIAEDMPDLVEFKYREPEAG